MREQWNESTAVAKGLYDPRFEHDNCGIGAVVNIKGIKTHQTVENALKIVENLKHRAGKDADGKTGDGVGILLQISHKFFKKAVKPLGIELGDERDYGVGMFFFPQDELKNNQAKKMFEVIVEKEGMEFLGWREVPIHPDKLSDKARDCMPCIMQAFVKRPEDVEKGLDFDRIQTVLSYITVRLIPFVVMQTRCLPVRRQWHPENSVESSRKFSRLSIRKVPILQCLITH